MVTARAVMTRAPDASGSGSTLGASHRATMIPLDVRSFAPMLSRTARDVDDVPQDWAIEEKWDGVRIVASSLGDGIRLATRSGRDFAERVPELASLTDLVESPSWVLDGELVLLGRDDRPDYRGVMSMLQSPRRTTLEPRVRFVVFDLLAIDGVDLRSSPWSVRRDRLDGLLEPRDLLMVPEPTFEPARDFLQRRCSDGCEGLVAKNPDAPYSSGARPLRTWLKLVTRRHAEFVVTGWTPLNAGGAGDPSRVGALVIAARLPGGGLRDAGKVGSGFDDATRRQLAARLSGAGEPLVVDVGFAGWTDEGRLRHPSFRALREDLDAHTLVTEID